MQPQEIVIRVIVESPGATAPASDFKEVGTKERTPSQNMRLALLKRYERLGLTNLKTFETYYKEEMKRIIEIINKHTEK